MNIENSKDPFIAYCMWLWQLLEKNLNLKREFVIKYSLSKILPTKSPKNKTKQN